MEPFFSYRTFASGSGALGTELDAVAGEAASGAVPETMVIPPWMGQPASERRRLETSNEGAVTGDGLADDQVLHLIGTLVGVQRLGIGEKPRDVVIGDDAVAAEHLAAP